MWGVKAIAISCTMVLASGAFAQDSKQNLAEIRAELNLLSSQIEGLRIELVETSPAQGIEQFGTPLQRVDLIEAELRGLTNQVEQLQFRVEQIVRDGSNRIGDIEFRLTELEGGDVTQLGQTAPLGGTVPTTTAPANTGIELTVSERGDFETAKAALDNGEALVAADLFLDFTNTYPGGPLTAQAQYHRGQALVQVEDWKNAGRGFLDSFSAEPTSAVAPDALYWLGVSLGKLGKVDQACQALAEVNSRFGGHVASQSATAEAQTLGCG
ncbi:tol-pal system protein YbgF [Amylibacter marinus]|uniref:Cell division coordinator CpoB n=1 Tax=Amylibacter marinus TaxID=1475483 RepID=A0ABQ5VRF1_9RHOB|nr:tetratricopeptide repeat protein [Amylibacter marinus]GLQ33783.1 tol-pal system protein YbgF [Amylibacter marinus]